MVSLQIAKIVVTGGPCGGKSTAVTWIRKAFAERGWHVLFIPETATELFLGGVPLFSHGHTMSFQTCNLSLQLEKERVFLEAARGLEAEKVLIVCDRGTLDNLAYMTPEAFAEAVAACGVTTQELYASYDAVFHLVTAAKGAEKYYTTENNTVRTETPAEAAALDDRVIAAWQNHPYFYQIDNSTGFEDKMARLISGIEAFLRDHPGTRA